eukprot:424098_1
MGLLLLLMLLCRDSNSQACTEQQSYCLKGLDIRDYGSLICNQYEYEGILNNCSYFKSIDSLYLYWNNDNSAWYIHNNMQDGQYVAYCNKTLLDDCIRSTWYYFNGTETKLYNDLYIQSCTYNNDECLAAYTSNDSYCVTNTRHFIMNSAISGSYTFAGCHMNQPYFVQPKIIFNIPYNFTLQYDDMLSVWHITNSLRSAGAGIYSYCTRDDISRCNSYWYIWDGTNFTLDINVYSDYCDICMWGMPYDEICLIGGITATPMIGRYKFDKCRQLHPSYQSITNQSWILQYLAWFDAFVILEILDQEYIEAYCSRSDLRNCIESDSQWTIWNDDTQQYELVHEFRYSDCGDVDGQCNVNSDYCLDLLQHENITTFEFECCDSNNYPQLYDQHFGRISFDLRNSSFVIKTDNMEDNMFASCNGLLLDECNGFWQSNITNLTLYKCNERTVNSSISQQCDRENVKSFLQLYWYYFVAGGLIVAMLLGISIVSVRKRKAVNNGAAQAELLGVHDNEAYDSLEVESQITELFERTNQK